MRLTYMISTLGGLGGRVAFPGTIASLVTIFPTLAVLYLFGSQNLAVILCGLFVLAYWAVDAELKSRFKGIPQPSSTPCDPQDIVIDEVLGQAIALLAVTSIPEVLVAFVLFRVFDIAKPWPIWSVEQRVPGAAGIIIDDVLAGLFALIVLSALRVILTSLGLLF